MSFMKMPSQVVKKVVRIQREFLWGGVKGGRKVSWISWKTVCQDKKAGGLGVRDVKIANVALLAKWRWKLLQHDPGLWKEVLVAKYGPLLLTNAVFNGIPGARIAPTWWKDICAVEDFVNSKKWFSEASVRRINNGASTSFWSHVWLGDLPLADKFPRLFSLSSQRDAVISDVAEVNGDRIEWSFMWRRRLFIWEEELVTLLKNSLCDVLLTTDVDRWWWKHDPDGDFSVNSTYTLLFKELNTVVEGSESLATVFHQLWSSPAPSKIIAFSWQLLHNRIPTRDNLVRYGIIRGDSSRACVLCTAALESSTHLFLHCDFASRI
jgi:hypothetical protein